MQSTDQAKVLRKSLETSVNETMINHLMLPAAIINHNESKLLSGVPEYLKELDMQNVESRKVFFELLRNECNIDNDSFTEDELMRWKKDRKKT